VNGEKARGLVPPRPNLGPEPWREPDTTLQLLLALGVAVVIVLLAAWGWWRGAARRARGQGALAGGSSTAELSARDRLVGLSESIRDALTAQFGNSFRAKTTEELSADEQLVQLLGPEGVGELMPFLDRIDRLKFASERSDDHDEQLGDVLRTWEPRVTALAARIRARRATRTRPVASRSRPNGRPGSLNGPRFEQDRR
jgi:hypothetical protein